MTDYALKLVRWIDSRGASSNWKLIQHVQDDGICTMQSVGWVISETDNQLCIAPHMGVEDDGDHQVCGEMHIPKSCIQKVIDLSEKRSSAKLGKHVA